jgi:formiminoglutamate deiminase
VSPVTKRAWHADLAWLPAGQVREHVLIEVEGDRIVAVTPDVTAPPDACRLSGLALPGLADAHSHAFHRALRGWSEPVATTDDFWAWRKRMYAVAEAMDPDLLFELARATYAEMALAGIAAVGEFHYLHHGPGGHPYADPNAMGEALMAAAAEAGIRITLLDTCYLTGGFGAPLEGVQRRFGDGSVGAWADRVGRLAARSGAQLGAAIHSVRAVDEASMTVVASWARERRAPLHVHVSEQPAENQACLLATGLSPTRLLERAGVLGAGTTAVHATHLVPADLDALGRSGTAVCLCPTTERDLADGVGAAAQLAAAGCRLCLGSDSHAVIDLFEEARAVELDQRLVTLRRGHHPPERLLEAATAGGMAALGWDAGELSPGRLADICVLDLASARLAGWAPEHLAASVAFAATAADVTDLIVGGQRVVADRRHTGLADVPGLLARAVGRGRVAGAGPG